MRTLLVSLVASIAASLDASAVPRLRVGVVVPLTGPLAEYGVAIRNGIELARAEQGKAIDGCEFLYEDSRYSSPEAVTAFRSLREAKRINVLYAFGGPIGEALAPLAEQTKTPFLSDSIVPSVSEGRAYVFRYANSHIDYGRALANYLSSRRYEQVDLVAVENQYVNALVDGLEKSAQGHPSVNRVASVMPDESDMRAVAAKLARSPAGVLGIFLMPGQISSVLRNLEGRIAGKLIIGGDFFESPIEVHASRGMLDGALYPTNLVSPEFKERYLKAYKEVAQIHFAAEGYDVASLMSRKFCSRAELPTAQEILAELSVPESHKGALGETSFHVSERGDKYFSSPVVLMKVEGETFVPHS